MTDETKALVERLRGDWPEILVEKHWMMDSDAIDKQREEAADLIETQAREIERLNTILSAMNDTDVIARTMADLAKYKALAETLAGALEKIAPITVRDGPDYAEVYFADGKTHSTQAMTMNPQDWLDLSEALRQYKEATNV